MVANVRRSRQRTALLGAVSQVDDHGMSMRQLSCRAAAVLALWPAPADAHDIYTPLLDKWGRSCCSGADCRPAPYRITPSGIEMLVKGRWFFVPDATIQYRTIDGDKGETAGGHWCGQLYENGYITYCAFLPPKLTLAP
jgi:hypothetical protein